MAPTEASDCSFLVYEYSGPRRRPATQQALVDRLARSNWHRCGRPGQNPCRRCGTLFCAEHTPAANKRCIPCEKEYYSLMRRRRGRGAVIYLACVFASGIAVSAIGHRWGLLLVVSIMAMAPVAAMRFRAVNVRKRFLAQKVQRIRLPRASAPNSRSH